MEERRRPGTGRRLYDWFIYCFMKTYEELSKPHTNRPALSWASARPTGYVPPVAFSRGNDAGGRADAHAIHGASGLLRSLQVLTKVDRGSDHGSWTSADIPFDVDRGYEVASLGPLGAKSPGHRSDPRLRVSLIALASLRTSLAGPLRMTVSMLVPERCLTPSAF